VDNVGEEGLFHLAYSFLVLHCLLAPPPHIWAGGEMLNLFFFSIIIFFPFLALVGGIVLADCGRGYLGFSFLQKEDPQSMYKRICNNSYNVIPFHTIL